MGPGLLKVDSVLGSRLNLLSAQNDKLHQVEGGYLLQEAKRKTMEATIFMTASGGSVKDRESMVHADVEYVKFMEELSKMESRFNFEKRRYEILLNAYYGELACYKREMGLIQKEGNR